MTSTRHPDVPSQRMVRHVFWKYPILAVVLLAVIVGLALTVGSPNSPRETIKQAATSDPGGAVLAFTQELDGTSSSSSNAQEYGMGQPANVFVVQPITSALPLLRGSVAVSQLPTLSADTIRTALADFTGAQPAQRLAWASAYDDALGKITPATGGGGDMAPAASPDYSKIGHLNGDFGPVPALVETGVFLAQTGYFQQDLQAVDPGHSFHLVNIWLYDQPLLLNTAVAQGLTDDQWGMVKERGFSVGPWYLTIPAVFHVYFPSGTTGTGFILWNLGFAALLLFAVPLIPGVRDLPRVLKFYRFIYRYPKPGDFDKPELRERFGSVHAGASS